MIKFFRKIRQKLLSENKFSKYLLYAVGEIVLVVIGILIALKINNYNTELGNQKVLRNQLENVALEVDQNIALLNNTLEKSKSIINSSRHLANEISGENLITGTQLSQLLGDSFAPVLNYHPNMAILNEMIVTGTLRGLNNEELKRSLLAVQSKLAKLKNQEKLHAEDQKSCVDFMLDYGDFKAFMDDTGASNSYLNINSSKKRKGNQALLTSKEFENRLLLFIASGIGLQDGNYTTFKSHLVDIRLAIEQEINTNND